MKLSTIIFLMILSSNSFSITCEEYNAMPMYSHKTRVIPQLFPPPGKLKKIEKQSTPDGLIFYIPTDMKNGEFEKLKNSSIYRRNGASIVITETPTYYIFEKPVESKIFIEKLTKAITKKHSENSPMLREIRLLEILFHMGDSNMESINSWKLKHIIQHRKHHTME
ncbi:hypothetical protein [Oceanobacter mangrovi]|uniref:hypothetical protein n=1 Tax=Oceanobacter mangrovi TaxID=2862510 RepID=UPI001C8ED5DD|nr:hypothetical protein [Oceanobacter mangrovi]